MATILKARGRMTKDIVTPYEKGHEVVLVAPDPGHFWRLPVGARGTIRKIVISDANDGDETFLMFYVRFYLRFGAFTVFVHSSEFAPGGEGESYLWARRQIEGCALHLPPRGPWTR